MKFEEKYRFEDYVGKKFGLLTIIGETNLRGAHNDRQWIFRCFCGKEIFCQPSRVISGHKKSCGCIRFRNMTCERTGLISKSLLSKEELKFYRKWETIRTRCYNKKHEKYPIYGGRGIKMCDEWVNNAWEFIQWCKKTHPGDFSLTIDRIDGNGMYSPENCRWATITQQNRNRSNTTKIIYGGEEVVLSELAEKAVVNLECLRHRLKNGWEIERALTTPSRKMKKNVK